MGWGEHPGLRQKLHQILKGKQRSALGSTWKVEVLLGVEEVFLLPCKGRKQKMLLNHV